VREVPGSDLGGGGGAVNKVKGQGNFSIQKLRRAVIWGRKGPKAKQSADSINLKKKKEVKKGREKVKGLFRWPRKNGRTARVQGADTGKIGG